jgi:hypothetical protein
VSGFARERFAVIARLGLVRRKLLSGLVSSSSPSIFEADFERPSAKDGARPCRERRDGRSGVAAGDAVAFF